MQIIILADALQRKELMSSTPVTDIVWIEEEEEFLRYRDADAFIDLEFINDKERITLLEQLLPKPVVINSVISTLDQTHTSFARINGWNTFLSSSLLEAACHDGDVRQKVEDVLATLGKQVQWLPDEPGFVTARVISMIVNEAYLALGESVSTQDEINIAMKLGTAYPYGPFEWAEKIGLQNIVTLLQCLAQTQSRYRPSELMVQETNKAI